MNTIRASLVGAVLPLLACTSLAADIVHDAEYYVLAKQNGEKWAAQDKGLVEKLKQQ